MPHKPLKPCRYPGCPNLSDQPYCEVHRGKVAYDYNKYVRDKDHNKHYGREWRRIRDRYASLHPVCENCLKEGKITPMEEVHHILPINRGGDHSWNNLMSLCHSCHEKIHHELGDR